MAWRYGLRRRAKGAAGDGGTRTVADAPGAPGAAADGAAAATAPGSIPGDWDGGWRRTAPPRLTLTVARDELGVSGGLAFRSGLASWQNPSLGTGLGHALLPSAPVGLVHGVTRPGLPSGARTEGGPLLLRVPRPDAPDAAEGGPPAVSEGGAHRTTRTAPARPSGAAPAGPSTPPLQRTAATAPLGPGTAEPALPPVRRVAVLPLAVGARAPGRASAVTGPRGTEGVRDTGTSRGPGATRPQGTDGPRDTGTSRGSAVTAPRAADAAPVRTRPVGPPLTVARRMPGAVRRIAALRPAASGTAARRASDPVPSAAVPTPEAAPPTPPAGDLARPAGRATLGAPLDGLPPPRRR